MKKGFLIGMVGLLAVAMLFGWGGMGATLAADIAILAENFDNATADNFFTPQYKALSSNAKVAMYSKSGGTVEFDAKCYGSGALVLGGEKGGRFLIGCKTPDIATTDAAKTVSGELDLSKGYKISFKVLAVTGTMSKKFQITVDNNTTSAKNSPHGQASKIYAVELAELTPGKTVMVTSNVGAATSFIQLRVESTGIIVIDDLVISYQ